VDDASEVGSVVNEDDRVMRVLNPLNLPPLLSPVVGNTSEPGSVSGDDVAMRTWDSDDSSLAFFDVCFVMVTEV